MSSAKEPSREASEPSDKTGLSVPAVDRWGADNCGARAAFFEMDGLAVTVKHFDSDNNERVFDLACELARSRSQFAAIAAERDALRSRIKVQSAEPSRLLGTGYVRFRNGELWALNNKERGFGEFGFRFASWDELFRDFDVVVTSHGTDEHGAWWAIENSPARAALRKAGVK